MARLLRRMVRLHTHGLMYHVFAKAVSPLLSLRFLANVNSRSREHVNSRSRLLYIVARPSVVCNVRAPYSAGRNFRQCFYDIWYLGHLLISTENFYRDHPMGTPPAGELNVRGVPNMAILDLSKAISRKRCKIGGKLVLITNKKSYMSFPSVPKSVTLNDLEQRNGLYFVLFH